MERGVLVGILISLITMLSISVSASHATSSSFSTTKLTIDTRYLQQYPYLYPFQLRIDLYQCVDSDGGINPYERGAVWRIARNPSQACQDWVATYDQMCPPDPALCEFNPASCAAILSYCMSATLPKECFGTTGVDSCTSSSTVKEYYCSGSEIRYRYMSCAKGCSQGRCR